jgi:GAF domain-containing protein
MSDDLSMFEAALAGLGEYFLGDSSLDATLHRVALLSLEALDGAHHVGFTLAVGGRPRTAVYTDPEVPAIDQVQYETGDGPGLDAVRFDERYVVDSTRERGRWQTFRDSAFMYGVISTMSLPMKVNAAPVGAMNFYDKRERAFSDREIRVGAAFAQQAGFVLFNAQAYWDPRSLRENLRTTTTSGATIEQAKGIIMATMRCTSTEATRVLTEQAELQDRPLRDVAADIVGSAAIRRA